MSPLLPFIVAGAIFVIMTAMFGFGALLNWLETKMSLAPAFFTAACVTLIILATVASLAIRIL